MRTRGYTKHFIYDMYIHTYIFLLISQSFWVGVSRILTLTWHKHRYNTWMRTYIHTSTHIYIYLSEFLIFALMKLEMWTILTACRFTKTDLLSHDGYAHAYSYICMHACTRICIKAYTYVYLLTSIEFYLKKTAFLPILKAKIKNIFIFIKMLLLLIN